MKVSPNGYLLASKYKNGYLVDQDYDNSPEFTAYLTAFAKYQTNNPWRHNTIEVNFLNLLLNTVNYLNTVYGSKGISRKELPFFIVWPNNDYKSLGELIYKFRKKFKFKYSNETIYSYVMNVLDESTGHELQEATSSFISLKKKDYKIDKITHETPDDVMRKLRQTQIVSLRGGGYFLDINHFEESKIKIIQSEYGKNHKFSDNEVNEYFQFMGSIDERLSFENVVISDEQKEKMLDVKQKALDNWATEITWDVLKAEINIAGRTKGDSNHDLLKQLEKPVRLEFLASIVMKKSLQNVQVVPNYKVDDEGIPYSTASGSSKNNIGIDIDIYDGETHVLLEPTVSEGRSWQVEHELPSIRNHVITSIKSENDKYSRCFAIFLAGRIVPGDVGDTVASYQFVNGINIYPWETDDYVEYAKSVKTLEDFALIRDYAKPQVV